MDDAFILRFHQIGKITAFFEGDGIIEHGAQALLRKILNVFQIKRGGRIDFPDSHFLFVDARRGGREFSIGIAASAGRRLHAGRRRGRRRRRRVSRHRGVVRKNRIHGESKK